MPDVIEPALLGYGTLTLLSQKEVLQKLTSANCHLRWSPGANRGNGAAAPSAQHFFCFEYIG
jgi:hypothetical protein